METLFAHLARIYEAESAGLSFANVLQRAGASLPKDNTSTDAIGLFVFARRSHRSRCRVPLPEESAGPVK